jgi:hypothetical protein
MARYVTVARYADTVQAQLARAALDAEGIRATVVEGAGFNPILNTSLGTALEVLARDEEKARGILEALARTPEVHEDEDDDGEDVVRCPRCELEYCYFEHGRPVRGTVIYPLLVVFAIVRRISSAKRWNCHKCLYVWDDPGSGPRKITKLPPGHPRPVFRLFRGSPVMGAVIGLMVGAFTSFLSSVSGPLLMILGAAAGLLVGRSVGADICSEPTCRAVLPRGAEKCPGCKGAIMGRIGAAHEHYSAAADERRDIAHRARKEAEREASRRRTRERKRSAREEEPSAAADGS